VFVNLRDTTWLDREADAAVGKNTLATRWPRSRLRATYAAAALAAFAFLPALAAPVLPPLVAAAGFVALPFLARGAWRYTRSRSPFPTVAGMVLFAVAQLAAWARVAGRYSL
jgi:1,4-dihydroxy-2-naphthoate octaprenyltransferase